MAGFADNMASFFGIDPSLWSSIGGDNLAVSRGTGGDRASQVASPESALSGSSGGALTDVGADPSTPRGLQGTVLARLRPSIAGRLALQATNPNSADNLNNYGGVGGDLSSAIASSDPKAGRWGNFARGFTGAMARGEARDAEAAKNQRDSTKANIENLKTMFDAASKMADEQQTQANQAAIRAREEGQDAETKRWHDIQHQDTLAKINKDGSTNTDWGTPENMLNASRLEQAKLNELGLDHVSMRAATKLLNDPLTSDDQKKALQASITQAHQQFDAWRAQQPWANGGKKKTAPTDAAMPDTTAPAAAPTTTPIQGGTVPSNPPSPGFQPRKWRAATAPDGSRWLIDQNTGEKQRIDTQQPYQPGAPAAPVMAPNMTKTMQTAPADDNEPE